MRMQPHDNGGTMTHDTDLTRIHLSILPTISDEMKKELDAIDELLEESGETFDPFDSLNIPEGK